MVEKGGVDGSLHPAVGPLVLVAGADPLVLVSGPDLIGVVGVIATAFMVVAVVATLYLAFVGARHEQHGPASAVADAGDRPGGSDLEREFSGDE